MFTRSELETIIMGIVASKTSSNMNEMKVVFDVISGQINQPDTLVGVTVYINK